MLLVSFHWNTPEELESKSRASPIVERKCEYLKIVQAEKSTKLTEEQWLDMWGKRMQDFFGRPGDKTKARKGYQEPERLATLSCRACEMLCQELAGPLETLLFHLDHLILWTNKMGQDRRCSYFAQTRRPHSWPQCHT